MRSGLVGLALSLVVVALPAQEARYYPPPGQWAHKAPAEVGMDAARLNDAVEFMKAHETASPARDFSDQEIVNGKLLIIHIDPARDLVVVWRWSAQSAEGFKRVVAAITN